MKISKYPSLLLPIVLSAMVAFGCQPKPIAESPEIVYGPQDLVYEVPQVSGRVYFVATDGNAASEGLEVDFPTTIEAAVARVVTGDAIVMRGGIYRTGNLTFNQGIIIQPYMDEKPVLNGSLVADQWQAAGQGLWVAHWSYLFPAGPESWWQREREERFTPLHRFNNDGVFVDGQYLQSAGSKQEVNAGTFFVDYDANKIYIGVNPEGRLIEITAFRKAIFRTTGEVHGKVSDRRGPIIRGLEITQYPDTMVHIDGFYPQGISPAPNNGKDVVGTILEHNIFSNCFRIGVFAIGDSLIMRHNKVINTNTEGVYIVASNDVLLERNIFANNNIEHWTGFYPAAVKIFNQTNRVVCRENLVIDHPYSNGIWYDVGNTNGVFVNNRLENVGRIDGPSRTDNVFPSMNAFFFEISEGVLCAGNVFVNCDQGIFILNAKSAEVYNNTLINSRATFARTSRGDQTDLFGWHITTGPGVDDRDNHVFVNNLLVANEQYPRPLLFVWQQAALCERLNQPQLVVLDHNVFVRQGIDGDLPLVLWSPFQNHDCQVAFQSPAQLNETFKDFSANCKYFNNFQGSVFVVDQKDNFRLSPDFEGATMGTAIPERVAAEMQLKGKRNTFVGAFQPKE